MSRRSVIVNALTFSRLPLVFAWLGLALAEEYRGGLWFGAAALAALFLSGMTDLADGLLARRWNVVTPLGKMADPLMDKAVSAVVFPALAWLVLRQGGEAHSLVLLAFTVLYMLRDLWVTFLRSVGTMYGADVGAMWLGKVRTALTFPTAGVVYIYVSMHAAMGGGAAAALLFGCLGIEVSMLLLNAVSFVVYTRAYAPYLKKALAQKRDL